MGEWQEKKSTIWPRKVNSMFLAYTQQTNKCLMLES